MRKFYTFLLTFLCIVSTAFASIETIEQNKDKCLKGLVGNIPMANCSIEASSKAQLEINTALLDLQNIDNNQYLWKLYKKSTEASVNHILETSLGTMYYLFSKNNTYTMNINRLFVLNNLNKNIPYKQERYLSEELESCLSKSSTILDREKCYIKQTESFSREMNTTLTKLQTLLSKEEYTKLKNNQTDWLNYKNNTEKILSNKVSNLIKAQIVSSIYGERLGQLNSLIILHGAF